MSDQFDFAPPPTATEEDSGPSPIGVPKGYSITQQGPNKLPRMDERGNLYPQPRSTTQVSPLYFTGDEYLGANWSATEIWQMQQMLAKAGFLTSDFQRGIWDPRTRDAFKGLLALSNGQGYDYNRTLQTALETFLDEGGGGRYKVDDQGNVIFDDTSGSGMAPLITRTTDPAALRRIFRRAVIDTLGEGWNQDEINKLVASYNDVEKQRQEELYSMQANEQAGSVADIPSPEDFIQSQILERDPIGAQSHEALGFMEQFMQAANNPAWGVG